ncbi:MAG: hypothetical protein ACD_58C00016G0002 [uncultured bacterium]|nr:MAG: hypothetical protein ACD_58C00016G0002 [uncultured bacterium]
MELTPKQQIVELVNNSKKILVLTHVNPDGDAIGSTLALVMGLRKLNKEVVAACQDVVPNALNFLPETSEIKSDIQNQRDFIISINTTNAKVDKLGYKQNPVENRLDIVITPKSGEFSQGDVTITPGAAKFDLIFVLDAPELERTGRIYDNNPDVFYEVPIINIDHHSGNDYFGRVNWVDLTATSTAEILVSLLESLGREKSVFDGEIATALLTGIITDTGSFQHNNTTPKSFTVAAQLVAAGARQQEIIQHIYKTKLLSTLKLWGKILSNIHEERKHRFVWSEVRIDDFRIFNAHESETSGVIDELLKTVPDIDFAILLSEKNDGLHVSLRGVGRGINVAELAQKFGGGGHELAAAFQIPGSSLADARDKILVQIKEVQAKRLGLITEAYNNIPSSNTTSDNYSKSFEDFETRNPEDQSVDEVPLDQIDVT